MSSITIGPSPMNANSCQILVIDDEPLVRESIRKVFNFDGHTVEMAADGNEALRLFRQSSFDLIVTDYDMPGMKGDELAAAIKAIQPLQPILLISASGDQIRPQAQSFWAVDAVLAKPFRVADLREVVGKLLLQRGSIAQVASDAGLSARNQDRHR